MSCLTEHKDCSRRKGGGGQGETRNQLGQIIVRKTKVRFSTMMILVISKVADQTSLAVACQRCAA